MNITREPGTINSVRNPIGLEVQASAGYLGYDSYQIGVKVYYDLFHTNVYSKVDLDNRTTPDRFTGKVTFNVGRILKSLIGSDRPDWLSSSAKVCESNNFRFFIVIEEYINTSLDNSIQTSIYRAVNAGFSTQLGQFMESYVNSQKFLTHQPREKEISSCQREFLYYAAPDAGTYTLNADLTFTDGTTQIGYNTVAPSVAANKHDVLLFPCGFDALGLRSFQSPAVASYEVYLTGGKSERIKFIIDKTYQPRDRFYLFENSLGGYDTLRATGRLSDNQLTSSVVSQKAMPVFYDKTESFIQQNDTYSQGVFTQNTGIVSYDGADWLRDLLASEDTLRIGDQSHNPEGNGDYWPISIARGTHAIKEDDNFLYGQTFNYTDAFLNRGL